MCLYNCWIMYIYHEIALIYYSAKDMTSLFLKVVQQDYGKDIR